MSERLGGARPNRGGRRRGGRAYSAPARTHRPRAPRPAADGRGDRPRQAAARAGQVTAAGQRLPHTSRGSAAPDRRGGDREGSRARFWSRSSLVLVVTLVAAVAGVKVGRATTARPTGPSAGRATSWRGPGGVPTAPLTQRTRLRQISERRRFHFLGIWRTLEHLGFGRGSGPPHGGSRSTASRPSRKDAAIRDVSPFGDGG